jgi:hypothetical protein
MVWTGADEEGVASLYDYVNTGTLAAKKETIKNLADAMVKHSLIKESEIDLNDLVGTTSKMAKAVSENAKVGEGGVKSVCKELAKIANQHFKGAISLDADAKIQCEQFSDILHALSTESHSEYLRIYEDLKTVLANILRLREAMELALVQLTEKLDNCNNTDSVEGVPSISNTIDLMKLIMGEADRQIALLQTLLNVTLSPADKAIAETMSYEERAHRMIKSFDKEQNAGKFGSVVAQALRNMGNVGYTIAVAEKALKETGITAKEFAESKSTEELNKKILERSGKIQNGEEFGKFWVAAAKLFKVFDKRSKVAESLEKMSDIARENIGPVEGRAEGYDTVTKELKSPMEKRVEKLKETKKAILTSFNREIAVITKGIYDGMQALAKKSATEQLPITDKLSGFVRSLAVLKELQNKYVYLALSGLQNDPSSRKLRDVYIEDIKTMNNYLTMMMEMPEYSGVKEYFLALRTSLELLLALIGNYMDKVAQIWGGDVESNGAAEGRGVDQIDANSIPEFTRPRVELERVIKEFVYFFNVAEVRRNLSAAAKEIDTYGADYEKTLGQTIANRLEKIHEFRDNDLKIYNKSDTTTYPVIWPPTDTETAKKYREECARIITEQYKGDDDFYKVMQAVDLYARAYTKAVVKNPNDVRDLKMQLSDVEFIAKFYNDLSGENLGNVFEMFNPGRTKIKEYKEDSKDASYHYYLRLKDKFDASEYPADVSDELDIWNSADKFDSTTSNYNKIYEEIKKVIESNAILKNIVNVFVNIGNRFGGQNIESFMTPVQMYRALVDFIVKKSIKYEIQKPGIGAGDYTIKLKIKSLEAPSPTNVQEVEYFAMIVKTMIAKVFTTIGLYDLLERPGEIPSLAPIRMILGGDDEFPKVEEGAVELYIRLPLLAEYYRKLFNIDGDFAVDNMKFAMLPELEGVFSRLIKMIFKTTKYIQAGTYSDPDTREMILIINEIFGKFSSDSNPIQAAIFAFVAEINRRYGIVTQKDADSYDKLFKRDLHTNYGQELSDIAILPGEEDIQFDKLAPSDLYGDASKPKLTKWTMKDKLERKYYNLFRSFRTTIDDVFKEEETLWKQKSKNTDFTPATNRYSFKELINQGKAALKKASKDADRYSVAARLIQDVTAFTKVDHLMGVMFHEIVLSGLNVLNGVYKYLDKFRKTIMQLNPGEIARNIEKHAKDAKAVGLTTFAGCTFKYCGEDIHIAHPVVILNDFNISFNINGEINSGPGAPLSDGTFQANFGYSGGIFTKPVQSLIVALEDRYNYEAGFEMFMELIMQHTNDLQGLVEVKFAGDKMYIDYSPLVKEVNSLFETTRFYYNKFRQFLDDKFRESFEDPNKQGSLFFLEENLINDLIQGSKQLGADRPLPNIIKLNEQVSETFSLLTGEFKSDIAGGYAKSPGPTNRKNYQSYFTKKSFYERIGTDVNDIAEFDSSATPTAMLETRDIKNKVAYFRHLGGFGFVFDSRMDPEFYLQNGLAGTSYAKASNFKGVVVQFNNALFHLLRICFDSTTRHIYAPLINGLVSSSLNVCIMGNSYIPDLSPDSDRNDNSGGLGGPFAAFDNAKDGEFNISNTRVGGFVVSDLVNIIPNPEGILFHALSCIIQNLQGGFASNTTTRILTESLTDIPLFVRETMKANLPGFEKIFELLRIRCNFLRTVLEQKTIKCEDLYDGTGPVGKEKFKAFASVTKADQYKSRLDGILRSVSDACQTVVKLVKQVISDLNDAPKYMEMSQDFIADYEVANNKKPLALLSSILAPLVNSGLAGIDTHVIAKDVENEFMPIAIYGTDQFKYLYGTRQVLRSSVPANAEMVGRFNELVSLYNMMSNPMYILDTARLADFTPPLIKLTRFLVDAQQFKRLFTRRDYYLYQFTAATAPNIVLEGCIPREFAVIENRYPANAAAPPANCQIQNLDNLIDYVESRPQDEKLRDISNETMGTKNIDSSRDKIQIYNILDLNIVPINVHAMQRDLPLANLYNYSWTFDKMICSLLDVNTDVLNDPPDFKQSESRFMTRMIAYPYEDVKFEDYFTYMNNIFRGYTDSELGRPKYLSDQVFNKALFGEVYRGPYEWNKRGPQSNDRFTPMLSYNEIYMNIIVALINNDIIRPLTAGPAAKTGLIARIRSEGTEFLEDDNYMNQKVRQFIIKVATAVYNHYKKLYNNRGSYHINDSNDYSQDIEIKKIFEIENKKITDNDSNAIGAGWFNPGLKVNHLWDRHEISRFVKSIIDDGNTASVAVPNPRYDQSQVVNLNNFHLSFLKSPVKGRQPNPYEDVVVVPLQSATYRKKLNQIGYNRFNTNLVRSLVFLGQTHRLISYKVGKDLTAHNEIVIRGNTMIDPNVVDYALNRAYNGSSHMSTTPHSVYHPNEYRK